jgi:rhodanese-related sulfurtransferase
VQSIGREELIRMLDEGVQLVEVLPKDEFDEAHILGAVNIPLRRLAERAPRELDRARPVVVYCFDSA